MSWYPCACGACRCVGCISIAMSNIDAATVDCQDPVDNTYQGVRTAWIKQTTTRTPFDLIADAFVNCDDAEAAYPGTKCVFVADICCDPSVTDTDPGDGGGGGPIDPPPPPPPGDGGGGAPGGGPIP